MLDLPACAAIDCFSGFVPACSLALATCCFFALSIACKCVAQDPVDEDENEAARNAGSKDADVL